MQVGIDSFPTAHDDVSQSVSASERMRRLIEQIEYADQIGLDVFGIGEHHRREFLDSAPLSSCSSTYADKTHPSYKCCNGSECSRPSTGISRIRNPGSSVARPGGDGCGSWLFHRGVSSVRLSFGGL